MNLAKSNIVLLIVAGALAVPTWLQLRSEVEVFTDVGRIPLLFDGFTAENVGQVLLAQPKKEQPPPDPQNPDQKRPVAYDQLLLARNDKGWQLGGTSGNRAGAPVDKNRVERDVFAHLAAIRADREALVQPGATPEQLAEFGLDEEHAFVVRAIDKTGKNVVAELLVGREAGAGQTGTEAVRGAFVRKSDSTDVVLYEYDQQGWRRDVNEELWMDKVLARLDVEKARRLSIRNAGTPAPLVFAREDGKASWLAVEPPADVGAVRQSEVESLVQRLRHLAVQDFRLPLQRAGNLQQLGLQPPQIEIELTVREVDSDRVVKIAVGAKVDGKEELYLTSSESPFLMTWPAGMAAAFELDLKAQLFDPPAPQPAPTGPGKEEDKDKKQDGGK
jgi:hypothetical protein